MVKQEDPNIKWNFLETEEIGVILNPGKNGVPSVTSMETSVGPGHYHQFPYP